MKRISAMFIVLTLFLCLCSCNGADSTQNEATKDGIKSTAAVSEDVSAANGICNIVGTWMCNKISTDCYFIFEANGDAYVKWGTCTIYGSYSESTDDNGNAVYDMDVGQLLYDEYHAAVIDDKTIVLTSENNNYRFENAEFSTPDLPKASTAQLDNSLVGDWQSESSYECYRFNKDGTAKITDMYNYATIDCIFSCKDGTITFTYMSTLSESGTRQIDYSIKDKNNINLGEFDYERVAESSSQTE